MPRANRYILPGYVYHLTHRCHDRRYLLRFGLDRTEYCKRLRTAVRQHRVSLLDYCMTSNHTHLLAISNAPREGRAELLKEFQKMGIDPRTFRRSLRVLLGNKGAKPSDGVLKRSPGCKAVCSAAERMAAQNKSANSPVYLLRATFASLGEDPRGEDAQPVRASASPVEDIPTEL